MPAMTLVELLQIVVIPLVLVVLRDVRATREAMRTELAKMGERVASLETAVEISLGVKPPHTHNRRKGD